MCRECPHPDSAHELLGGAIICRHGCPCAHWRENEDLESLKDFLTPMVLAPPWIIQGFQMFMAQEAPPPPPTKYVSFQGLKDIQKKLAKALWGNLPTSHGTGPCVLCLHPKRTHSVKVYSRWPQDVEAWDCVGDPECLCIGYVPEEEVTLG